MKVEYCECEYCGRLVICSEYKHIMLCEKCLKEEKHEHN